DLTMEVIRNTDRLIGELSIPESIRMVIRTAITWNRDHRFRSATEFAAALSAALGARESLPALAAASVARNDTVLATKMPALSPTLIARPAPPRRRTLPPEHVTSIGDAVEIAEVEEIEEVEGDIDVEPEPVDTLAERID